MRLNPSFVLQFMLRVRSRTESGPAGVQGVLEATVAISGDTWRPYAVRFDEFKGPAQLLPVGNALFRQFWPQIQFQLARTLKALSKPVNVWLDDLAFGVADQASVAPKPPQLHPGQDRVAEVTQQFKAAAVTGVAAVSTGRARGELRAQWTFVPWHNAAQRWGTPATVSLPHVWTGRREFVSGW